MQAMAVGSGLLALALAQAATRAPAPRTTASEPMTLYRLRVGDTLEGLAVRYLTDGRRDVAVVARVNGLGNSNRIAVGSVLRIPTRLLKLTPVTLTAIAVTGPVLHLNARGGAVALAKGDTVGDGDRISTGADAYATLAKPDGSRVTLPSHTTLRLAVLRKVALDDSARVDLVVESGRARMTVSPLRQAADRFEIRTPGSVAAVRGTEFRVAYDAAKTVATLEVLRGRVAESATEASPTADIAAGLAAQRPLGGERRILPLPPAPALAPPAPQGPSPTVTFKIADPHPGWSYHFVLARDPQFTDIFAEATVADGSARFDVPPLVPVSARITAIDEHGIEGLPRTYVVEREPPPSPTSGG
jgi:hypothetical protein